MEIKQLERKINDYLLRTFKWITFDIIIAFIIIKVQSFNLFMVFALILLCSMISTYDNLDRYRLLKMQKRDLMMQ